jgi:hypothetical protein
MDKKKGRVDGIEIEKRIFSIYQILLQGYTKRRFILQYVSEKTDWNIDDRQIDNYIKKAKELILEKFEDDIDFEKSLSLQRFEQLYTMNYKIQDYKECRSIIEARCKLLGINAPTKIAETDVSGKDRKLPTGAKILYLGVDELEDNEVNG